MIPYVTQIINLLNQCLVNENSIVMKAEMYESISCFIQHFGSFSIEKFVKPFISILLNNLKMSHDILSLKGKLYFALALAYF